MPPSANNNRQRSEAFYALAIAILLAAFALRLVALTSLPLSVDEDSHIIRAYEVMGGNLYIGFQQQKWLYTVALALFQPSGPESVWLGRVLSILCGGFSAATVITLARLLARRAIGERAGARAGLAAGLIYAVLPMAVFHERQALVDPLMVAFAMFSVLLAMRLARRPRFVTGLLLALALSGAVLTKASALPFLVFPALAALLLARRRALPGALALSVVAAVAAWLAYQEVADQARQAGIVPRGTHRPHLNNLVTGASTPAQALATFQSNLADIAEGLLIYVGPATLALAALALLWLLWGRARRETLFVAASTALFAATLALSKQVTGHGYLPPRYMLPSTLPIVALAGCALAALPTALARLGKAAAPTAGAALLAVILVPALRFDVALIRDPLHVALSPIDERQYRENFDHENLRAAVDRLLAIWEAQGQQRIRVMGNGPYTGTVYAYLGMRVADVEDLSSEMVEPQPLLARWLASGDPVFLLDYADLSALDALEGAEYESLDSYHTWELLRVTGAHGALADAAYASLVDSPAAMSAEYDELAMALAPLPRPRFVAVYPSNHAPELARRTGLPAAGLHIGVWPLTPEAVGAAVRNLALLAGDEPVSVVIVDAERSDPDGAVALAFQRTFYHTGSAGLAGRFHWQQYVPGPLDPAGATAHTVFEDAIHLDAQIVDPQVLPGEPVRVAVEWQTDVPVQDSFHVFAHLVDASGALVAQHDTIPGDGLLPMTGWPPGQAIPDRFAIPLPPDIAPGTYEVHMGIYDLASGLRLRVTAGDETGPDYAVLGRVDATQEPAP